MFVTIWMLFIAFNVVYHWYLIERLKREPDHIAWAAIRVGAAAVIGGFTGDLLTNMVAAGLMFPFFFNYPLNLLRGKPLGYLSDRGLDWVLKKIAPEYVWLFWLAILAAGGVSLGICGWDGC